MEMIPPEQVDTNAAKIIVKFKKLVGEYPNNIGAILILKEGDRVYLQKNMDVFKTLELLKDTTDKIHGVLGSNS